MKASFYSLVLLSCAGFVTQSFADSINSKADNQHVTKLTILHTNDHHGRFWRNKRGEYGMAARKTLIDKIRAQAKENNEQVLLFSGGDINTGVPESDLQNAEPDFKGMSKIGYDAMALGNHEFDNPISILKQQSEWANFPFLSANIYDKKTGKRIYEPYKIFQKDDVKIVVIGLTTEDTQKIGNPEYISGLEFKNPVEEAKTLIPQIKEKEKPDLIFAITHMGHYQNAGHGGNAPGDVTLARSLPEGSLDMIIGGHSQNPVCMSQDLTKYDQSYAPGKNCQPDKQNGTWIVQAYEWGKYVGRADFSFKDGTLSMDKYQLLPVNLTEKVVIDGKKMRKLVGEKVEEDKKMLEFLSPYQERGQDALNEVIGKTNNKLEGDRDVVRFHQTNLGRLIATAQMEKVKADFGIMNSGGVRDSIPKGNITYKHVLMVQPFANIVTKVSMNGKDLKKYLNVVATKQVDTGAYPQFAGIAMKVDNNGVYDIKIRGKAFDENKMYSFSIPSYNAAGGDGYPKVDKLPTYINTGFVDAQVLKDYIQKKSPIKVKYYEPKKEVDFTLQLPVKK
ncbi:MAG: bifunctional UDP-sugar hydrolase/5'-nucleotidase [Gammaproteobacteria bacterium]|nr:bifunctional UDP-sugar hydrolase/5'-nucleotidase [Gammaproteobacteria bacterium]